MPFLKFARDKRGYENYYLFDGKGRARLLFWFRTPPQVKVGRVPFSDDVRRMVEAQNPGVFFDWARIMSTPIPSPDVDHWRERRRVEKAAKRAAREAEAEEAEEARAAAEAAGKPAATEEPASVQAEAAADAGPDAEADAGVEAETPAASSDVQNAPPGHRRRRRRRRGRRGGGQPPPPPGVAVAGTDVTPVTDDARPDSAPSIESEPSSNDEV